MWISTRELALDNGIPLEAIYIVVGIIIIEGIWLAYLSYMMWKRHVRERKEAEKEEPEEKTEAEVTGEEEAEKGSGEGKKV